LSKSYQRRLVADYLGQIAIGFMLALCVYSLILDCLYWGFPQGLVLGRLFNRNDGGGVHTLSVLATVAAMAYFTWRSRLNWILAIPCFMLADYYHEGIWNIPYYLHYNQTGNLFYYAVVAVLCSVFFGAGLMKGKAHNFRHILYLLPWFAVITAYLLLVGHYSEDLFGQPLVFPQIYYANLWVNGYEVFEVALFMFLLCLGLGANAKEAPIWPTAMLMPSSYGGAQPSGDGRHGGLRADCREADHEAAAGRAETPDRPVEDTSHPPLGGRPD